MKRKSGPARGAWSRRPSFAPRQMLTAELLNAGLEDELMRQRLLNRAVHGFGVVLGFAVALDQDETLDLDRGCIELSPGLALDRHGRMLLWGGGRIGIRDLVGPTPERPGRYTLCAHFSARTPLAEDCHPFSGDRANWSEDGVVFSLRWDCRKVDRGCPDHPDGACVSHEEYLGRRTGGLRGDTTGSLPASPDLDWLLRRPGDLSPTGGGEWTYDPDPEACVPIACVQICDLADHGYGDQDDAEAGRGAEARDGTDPEERSLRGPRRPPLDVHDCEPRYGFCPGSEVETSRIRPLVYRNPLLYELVKCCDVELVRVESISWQGWINGGWPTPVPWEAFAERITSRKEGFEVWFTKRLDRRTVHEASIFLTAAFQDDDASWRSYRVPLARLDSLERGGQVRGVRLIPDEEWLNSEVTGRRSNLFGGARIEVTIRGQLLRDEGGQMLDARPLGLECGVRCQARPGDDLVSAFQIAPHPRYRSATHGPRKQDGSGESPDETGESGRSAE